MKGRCLGVAVAVCCALLMSTSVVPAQAARGSSRLARPSIVGGGAADAARWPFIVAIFRKDRLHCAGSVIAPTKVLTAGHCVLGFNLSNFTAVVGRTNLRQRSTGASIPISAAEVHPDYASSGLHDMAVLTLSQPAGVPPLELVSAAEDATAAAPGALARVAGWGARHPFGFKLSAFLKRTTETVRNPRRCLRAYTQDLFNPETMICALGRRIRRFRRPPIHSSACTGDSGAPLIAETPRGPRQIGLVSFGGAFCGWPGAPTVYARVSSGLDFISS